MSAQPERAVVRLTIAKPNTLADVVKWAGLAEGLYFPQSSTVQLSMSGELTVLAYISQVEVPSEEES